MQRGCRHRAATDKMPTAPLTPRMLLSALLLVAALLLLPPLSACTAAASGMVDSGGHRSRQTCGGSHGGGSCEAPAAYATASGLQVVRVGHVAFDGGFHIDNYTATDSTPVILDDSRVRDDWPAFRWTWDLLADRMADSGVAQVRYSKTDPHFA